MYIMILHHLTNYIIAMNLQMLKVMNPICHGTVTAYDIQDDGTTACGYGI